MADHQWRHLGAFHHFMPSLPVGHHMSLCHSSVNVS